jgi:hypothetical protein
MIRMRRPGTVCRITALSLITALVFCEFLVYYITLYSCAYPEPGERREEDELRVMVLADTHLLGKCSALGPPVISNFRQGNTTV